MNFLKLFSSGRYLHSCRVPSRFYGFGTGKNPDDAKSPCQEAKEVEESKDSLKLKGEQGADGEKDSSNKGLVLGVYEDGDRFELTGAAVEINQKSGGKLCKHLSELSSQLKLGKAFVVTDLLPEYSTVAIASYGPKGAGYNELEMLDEAKENVRIGVGAAVRALRYRGAESVAVVADEDVAEPAAEAALLAAWSFQRFKSAGARSAPPAVSPHGPPSAQWAAGVVQGRAQNWARMLADTPPNAMTPVDFAQEALDVLCPLGVKVLARDLDWISSQRMEAVLAVARGSCEPPLFLECAYSGAPASRPPVLIAAKGVTYDSGGLSLKREEQMAEYGDSLAGAAAALGALRMLAELKVPVNVRCVIPLCENMVSGQCMKVGDVITTLNGLSVQIEEPDMEGRLLLADALVYGQAAHRPALVLDVATVTRGAGLALGGAACGALASSCALWRALSRAGASSGDRAWRLPLFRHFAKQQTDEPAVDLRNRGSGHASACLYGAFLRNFVCGDWLHLDTSGVCRASADSPPYLRAGRQTGRPARTIAYLLKDMAEACKQQQPQAEAKDPEQKKLQAN